MVHNHEEADAVDVVDVGIYTEPDQPQAPPPSSTSTSTSTSTSHSVHVPPADTPTTSSKKGPRSGILGLWDRFWWWCNNNAWVTRIKQQQLHALRPIITPCPMLTVLFILGCIFAAIGIIWVVFTYEVVESKVYRYDNLCNINNKCSFVFELDKEMKQPVYFYYRLENYYQNHRRYMKSRSDDQLRDAIDVTDYDSLTDECFPRTSLDDDHDSKFVYVPCGLVAASVFNDTFTLRHSNKKKIDVTTDDVAWQTDLDELFKNPGDEGGIRVIKDFKDPHFVVWMRTAALPNFNKLYYIIEEDLPAGIYQIDIENRYPVHDFDGRKYFKLTTTTWLGGRQHFIGWAYICVCGVIIILFVLFLLKQILCPRKLGDPKYLVWNRPNGAHSASS